MKSYSGSVDFEFKIERYYDPKNFISTGRKQLINEKDLDDNIEYELDCITLYVSGGAYYYPGKFFAAPENCYPDESDTEILSVEDENQNDFYNLLTKNEIDDINSLIVNKVQNNLDYDDRD